MRLVTFEGSSAGVPRLGVVQGDRVIPLGELEDSTGAGSADTMLRLIERGVHDLRGATEGVATDGIALEQVRLCAPIPRPNANIICLGRNYQEHAAEGARAREEEVLPPTFFTKAVTTVVGPYDDIQYDRAVTTELDWEVELAVIVGRRARKVSRQNALDHVFGYTVLNDVSARDLQYGFGGQFFYGKSLDGACPMGPWIVTADEVGDPQRLPIRLRVNGALKQEANTADMIYGVAETIEILSRGMTLEPGQIIATGTPAGVGFARTPPEYLRPGDVVESEIDGIGTMRNMVQGA